ncbi:MAG: DUF421 domain-containing protein [Clostridia bacterium]|nr:DUF421 domain-containing protein [Clostridia bacterium]
MTVILFRTIFIYFILSVVLRCMGKRQVGELELSDLVVTLLLSEVAALPIADHNMPLLNGLFPVLLILSLEIISTFLKNKIPLLKKMMEGKPSILICRGRLDQHELGKMRLSIEELLGECRLQGYSDLRDIYYAILEQDGQLSIIPCASKQPLCADDIGQKVPERGMAHPLIMDGRINENHLSMIGKNRAWLEKTCKQRGFSTKDVFFMTMDDTGKIELIPREKKK